jgi:hypothetical protein
MPALAHQAGPKRRPAHGRPLGVDVSDPAAVAVIAAVVPQLVWLALVVIETALGSRPARAYDAGRSPRQQSMEIAVCLISGFAGDGGPRAPPDVKEIAPPGVPMRSALGHRRVEFRSCDNSHTQASTEADAERYAPGSPQTEASTGSGRSAYVRASSHTQASTGSGRSACG